MRMSLVSVFFLVAQLSYHFIHNQLQCVTRCRLRFASFGPTSLGSTTNSHHRKGSSPFIVLLCRVDGRFSIFSRKMTYSVGSGHERLGAEGGEPFVVRQSAVRLYTCRSTSAFSSSLKRPFFFHHQHLFLFFFILNLGVDCPSSSERSSICRMAARSTLQQALENTCRPEEEIFADWQSPKRRSWQQITLQGSLTI